MTQPNLTVLIPPQKPPLTRADAQADMIACGIKPRERILHQPLPAELCLPVDRAEDIVA